MNDGIEYKFLNDMMKSFERHNCDKGVSLVKEMIEERKMANYQREQKLREEKLKRILNEI